MSILMWDKPEKKLSTEAWKSDAGFDGGPTGGYQPNMSNDDMQRWKAKLTGHTKGYPQVEIRKSFTSMVQCIIIVSLGNGYTYKNLKPRSERYEGKTPADIPRWTQEEIDRMARRDSTQGVNVHMALNGGAQMTFADFADMQAAVEEARAFLKAHYPASEV